MPSHSHNMYLLSYFTDLQGSQTSANRCCFIVKLSYFTDLQGSQTNYYRIYWKSMLSYFTDLQGSQTLSAL